jgi:two-component system response regulator MprA
MRILIVEDEKKMATLLRNGLEEEHHSVVVASDGMDGLTLGLDQEFDAIVLDIMMPGIDGFEVARRLRGKGNRTPILIITARDTVADVVKGLDRGADDYLTKPFSFEEFVARLRAIGRRGPISKGPQFQVADLVLDPATHHVSRSGKQIFLTKKEYQLLELLMRNQGRVVSREMIIDSLWGTADDVESNTIDAFIKKLRQKVDAGAAVRLHTVRGFGYRCDSQSES